MTTFVEYRVQIGVATNPEFPLDGSPPVLPLEVESRRALADAWRRTAHIVFEPTFDSRITYAIREQLEAAVSNSDADGLCGVWQASWADTGMAFLNRDELLSFLREVVRERAPAVKPTAYLASCNSDDFEFLAGMNEPLQPVQRAELEAEMERFLAQLGELRPGERYALIVEQN
jgi:hypothetical protein